MNSKHLVIEVILDTNCLFETGYRFVRFRTRQVIARSQGYSHIRVTWKIPGMVRLERKYQILNSALTLMRKSIEYNKVIYQKDIKEDDAKLARRIDKLIDSEMAELQIEEIPLRTRSVDWKRLITDSAMRRPPFTASEQDESAKEKGFRDAVILETLAQYIAGGVAMNRRVIFISDDRLLGEAIGNRIKPEVLSTMGKIEDLETHLISFEAQLESSFVAGVLDLASRQMRGGKGNPGLFWTMQVFQELIEQHTDVLQQGPGNDWDLRSLGYELGATALRDKKGSRFTFATQLFGEQEATREAEVFEPARPEASSRATGGLLGFAQAEERQGGILDVATGKQHSSTGGLLGDLSRLGSFRTRTEKQLGRHEFELVWDAALQEDGGLTDATLQQIVHVSVSWTPVV
jgi:hypothetical protein